MVNNRKPVTICKEEEDRLKHKAIPSQSKTGSTQGDSKSYQDWLKHKWNPSRYRLAQAQGDSRTQKTAPKAILDDAWMSTMALSCLRPRKAHKSPENSHSLPNKLQHGQKISRFRIFMKRGKALNANTCANTIAGDVVIMHIAVHDTTSVVNMRSTDSRIADYVFHAYV
ncbi:hypothetical protein B0H13DRAFT_1904970 [Mycena leptocephala]|nr:hypothetical protein B0H13DRAFT_1904970 [Mycena leptocephala]